jgi:DNA-binding MarR family transcriptional regulator
MSAADNSREAYAKHWRRLDTLRFEVYDFICRDPGNDDITIAKELGRDINSITGRITELVKEGLVATVNCPNVKGNTARRTYPR